MTRRPRRRLLSALLTLTLLVMVLDVAGGPGPQVLRTAGGVVFGPLERLVAAPAATSSDAAALRQTSREADQADRLRVARQLDSLVGSPGTRGRPVLAARVVAVGRQGPGGPERVTVDVGTRDGVRRDLAVVSADGLVGRVVALSPWTCDVLLVGSADLVVAVRTGRDGVLGSVGGGARGARRRPAGQLALTAVQQGRLASGDVVTTLGSPGGVPFPAGLRVGTVAQVDPAAGAVAPSAAVRPAADVTRLDLVGVLLDPGRSVPRAPLAGAG